MPSNLKDVAKALNISVSTVSRVVNNKSYVKAETREKILRAIEEMNYTPNLVARSLKNKNTRTVGVLIPDISEDFFDFVIKGIDSALRPNNYAMILCDTGESPEKEEEYINLLLEKQIDGVILATVSKEGSLFDKLFSMEIPALFIDNLPNIQKNYDSVIIDNSKASEIATEHLLKLGHKKIGIITGKIDETTGYERLAGYKKVLTQHHISIDEGLIRVGDYKEESGYQHMLTLLEKNPDMTAVYVISSKMTYGAIKAIQEKGLRIPDDIALIGFDIHDASGLMSPSITTIMQPEQTIGKVAAELMMQRLQSKTDPISQKIVLSPELVIRKSCGFRD